MSLWSALALPGYAVIAAFQLSLALGAPWGVAAYGGGHPGVLPRRLRATSGLAVSFWAAAGAVVAARAGVWDAWWSPTVTNVVVWALVGLEVVAVVLNAASRSRWERFGWAPFAAALAILTAIVARG